MKTSYVVGGVILVGVVGMIGWALLKPKKQSAPVPPPTAKPADPFSNLTGALVGLSGTAATVFNDPGFQSAVGSGVQGLLGALGNGSTASAASAKAIHD